jgi:hypothetical protein
MNCNAMTENYKKQLEIGLKFQDFISDKLIESLGIPLTSYSSKEYQNYKGENRQGFEIKFDDRFKETNNLYIEIEEKSNPDNAYYVKSGIYRDDNTWLYLIGDYDEVFIFGKKILQFMHKSNNYRIVTTPTSKGLLVPKNKADELCIKKLVFKKEDVLIF